jgi:hypothetical protein
VSLHYLVYVVLICQAGVATAGGGAAPAAGGGGGGGGGGAAKKDTLAPGKYDPSSW